MLPSWNLKMREKNAFLWRKIYIFELLFSGNWHLRMKSFSYSLRVNNLLHLWSEEMSFVGEWISLNSNSSRVKIHYSTSGISSGSLDSHSKRCDHWHHYPGSDMKIHSIFLESNYVYMCIPTELWTSVSQHGQTKVWNYIFPTTLPYSSISQRN